MRISALLIATMAVGGCAGTLSRQSTKASGARAMTAELRDGAGAPHGTVKIDDGRMIVSGVGMAAGAHGLHIHEFGRCEGPDFKTAGGHWNPDMKQHGRDNPMGSHRGDFPNLLIGADGTGSISVVLPGGGDGLIDADGASVIVHAGPDDFKTDPSGNSGARLACAVLKAG